MNPVIGHQNIQQMVAELSAASQFPHAIILHGAQGIGKRTLANHLAHFLICGGEYQAGQGLTINQASPLYAQLQAGAYADFHLLELTDKTKISIDATRDLLERLTWTADHPRVIIIDSLDDLNPESANALLKTLEEPNKNTYFLLIAHQLSKTLPTILSRCRKIAVKNLTKEETQQVLNQQDVLPQEQEILLNLYPHSPGQALQFGTSGQDILALLNQPLSTTTMADKLAQKKLVPQTLSLLMSKIHTTAKQNPTNALELTALYQSLKTLKQNQATHNLSANWVLEDALNQVKKSAPNLL